MRLLAISDLHVGHPPNRQAITEMRRYPDDWLIVAGDVGERPAHLEFALQQLTARFAKVFWVPGNHDLWTRPLVPSGNDGQDETSGRLHGPALYDHLIALCRSYGVVTPEDEYVAWPDEDVRIVPMFLLFDYSFRPVDVPRERAVAWARESGVYCADERLLDPAPWPTREAWCHARCALTEPRLTALPASTHTILVNHWPLRYDLARPPRIPRFSIWCGTTITEDWAQRFRARVVVSGHLHLRTTLWRHGVRYDEVSLGYPRDWHQERGVDWYLREILPGAPAGAQRFTPPRDPFRI
jgi:calcineurin-like phosphoesterase family protein